MTFARGVFLFALLMLGTGIVGSKLTLSSLSAGAPEPTMQVFPTYTPTVRAVAHARPTRTPTAAVTATASPTLAPSLTATPMRTSTATPNTTPTPPTTPTATTTPFATPSPTPGTVTLARYWVGQLSARPGQTVSIGYVVDNGTGKTQSIMLGASIKSSDSSSWVSSIDDPSHDVVAVVPPGTTTHIRYFTLPGGLRPGTYDVAWGMRDTATGRREALVAAASVIHVNR